MSQYGGDGDKLYTILQLEKILYLPRSSVFNNEQTDKYMECVDSYTLMYLIDKLNLNDIDSLNNIFKPSKSGGAEGDDEEDFEFNPPESAFNNEPTDDTPMDDEPTDDTPMDDEPTDDTPMDDTPMDDTPMDDAPMDDTPMDDAPMDDTAPAPMDDTAPAPMDDTEVPAAPIDDTEVPAAPMDDTAAPPAPIDDTEVPAAPIDDTAPPAPMDDTEVPAAPMDDTAVPAAPMDDTAVPDEQLKNTKYDSEIGKSSDTPNKVDPELLLKVPEGPKDTNYNYQYDDLKESVSKAQEKIMTIQKEIAERDMKLNNFKCVVDDPIGEYFNLFDYVLDCSNICIRDINWYNIILNQEKFDNEYELEIEKKNSNYIRIDVEELNKILLEFVDDDELEEIFRNRIVQCAYMEPKVTYPPYDPPPMKPDPMMRELVEKYNKEVENYKPKKPEPIIEKDECHMCMDDCILYLNPSYKGFLYKKHDRVNTVEKIRMLVYCELRLNELMKYLKLESDRLFTQNYERVTEILNKIKDKNEEFMEIKSKKDLDIERNTEELADLNKQLADKKKELSVLMTKINEQDKQTKDILSGGDEEGSFEPPPDITGEEIPDGEQELTDDSDMSSDEEELTDDSSEEPEIQELSDDSDLSSEEPEIQELTDDSDMSSETSEEPEIQELTDDSSDESSYEEELSDDSSDESDFSEMSDESELSEISSDSDGDITEEEKSDEDDEYGDDVVGDNIDILPNCKTIAEDIKNGIIKRDNFVYLTNKCLDEVDKALRS